MISFHPSATHLKRISAAAIVGTFCLASMTSAFAQHRPGALRTPGIDRSGQTSHEIMSCNSGMTQEDKPTCLLEARNAALDRKKGQLEEAGHDSFADNRMKRCEVFKDAESQAACVARVKGMGETEGNVSKGGVLMEVETIKVPAGAKTIRIDPKTDRPVLLIPNQRQ